MKIDSKIYTTKNLPKTTASSFTPSFNGTTPRAISTHIMQKEAKAEASTQTHEHVNMETQKRLKHES